ncbi:MAG: hypothetical protein E7503_03135 [Ruminococcus sp.]|nr:hypothetical protein [Ruminococcus sp.]
MDLKKIMTFVVCTGMSMTLAACTDTNGSNPDSKAAETTGNSSFGSQKDMVTVNDEILNADPYEHMVQIGNNKIDFPLTVEKLVANGFEYADSNENAIDYLMDINARKDIDFLLNGTQVSLFVGNDTGDYAPISACKADYLTTNAFGEQAEYLIFPGGVRIGFTKNELIAAWGEPYLAEDCYNDGIVTKKYYYVRYYKKEALIDYPLSYCDERYTVTLENDTVTGIQRSWSNYTGSEDADREVTSNDGAATLYYTRNPDVYDRVHDEHTGIITVTNNDYLVSGNSILGYIYRYPYDVAGVSEAEFQKALTKAAHSVYDSIEYKKISMSEDDGIWVGYCTDAFDSSFYIVYALAFDNSWYYGSIGITPITPNAPITDEVKERLYMVVEDMLLSAHQK